MGLLKADWKKGISFDPVLPDSDDIETRRRKGQTVAQIAAGFGERLFDFKSNRDQAKSDVDRYKAELDAFYRANKSLTPEEFKSSDQARTRFGELREEKDSHGNLKYPTHTIDELEARFFRLRNARGTYTNLGSEVGFEAALTYVRMHIAAAGGNPKKDILISRDRGDNTFDVVAIINERLVIIEAKGGPYAQTSTRDVSVNGITEKAYQGSRLYLADLLRVDFEFRRKLRKRMPELYDDIRNGEGTDRIDFFKVHAKPATAKGTPGRVLVSQAELGPDRIKFHDEPIVHPKQQELARRADRHDARLDVLQGLSTSRAARVSVLAAAGVVIVGIGAGSAGATPVQADRNGSDSNASSIGSQASFGDEILAAIKVKTAEFSRMLSSLKDHVQNALSAFATMVWDAVSKVSEFASGVVDSVGAQGLIEEASKLWAEGQDLINLAMLLSPVGSVAEAISLAITVVQTLVQHWDQVRAGFDWALKNVLVPVADFFTTAFKIYITPYRVVFDAVMAGFNGMGGVVGRAVGSVKSVVGGIVRAIGEILQKLEIDAGPFGHFGLKPLGDLMVNWAARMADGGLVKAPGARGSVRPSGIHVMAVIDQSVVRVAREERRKVGYAYRPPFLHDGALVRTANGDQARTIDLRVPDVDSAFAQIKSLRAQHDVRFETAGV
ncbi:hypothetical protein VMT65_22465 [Nocardia sp. CDC153]|uniref:hypothetical protein n=1 Tax=Nocardia sp. CDC153 TaxID=3112167 RepID=UPI002DBD44F4|nr:hypothetical protein [Nocardia sp. CDC153]MEC3955814.1 hypothetical protein [Nocardia sp. CDC153]